MHEFQRDSGRREFKVTLRTPGFAATPSALAALNQKSTPKWREQRKDRGKDPALGDGKTAVQAQLLLPASSVRNRRTVP